MFYTPRSVLVLACLLAPEFVNAATIMRINSSKGQMLVSLSATERRNLSKGKKVTVKKGGKKISGSVIGMKRSRALIKVRTVGFRAQQKVRLYAQANRNTDEFGYPVSGSDASSSQGFQLQSAPLSPFAKNLYADSDQFSATHSLRAGHHQAFGFVEKPGKNLKIKSDEGSDTYKFEGLKFAGHGWYHFSNGVRAGAKLIKQDGSVKSKSSKKMDDNRQTIGIFAAAAVNATWGGGLELIQVQRKVNKSSATFQRAIPSVMMQYEGNELIASWLTPMQDSDDKGPVSEPGYFKVDGRHALMPGMDVHASIGQKLYKGAAQGLKNSFFASLGLHYEFSSTFATFAEISHAASGLDKGASLAIPQAVGGQAAEFGAQMALAPEHQIEGKVSYASGSASAKKTDYDFDELSFGAGYTHKF